MIENEPEVVEEPVETVTEPEQSTEATEEGDKSPFRAGVEAEISGEEPKPLGATGPAEAKGPTGPAGATAAAGATATAPVTDEQKAAAAVAKEIKDLGIKNKSAKERFEALSKDSRELADIKKTLPEIQQKAEQQTRMLEVLADTGANPDQLSSAFKYLKAVNSQDPKQLNEAFDFMSTELRALGKHLGREVEAVDPLAAYPDLLEKVEEGNLTRPDALEIVRGRATTSIATAREQRQQQQNQSKEEHDREVQQAMHGLGQFEAATKPLDPHWDFKVGQMTGFIETLKENVSPAKWASEFRRVYATIAPPRANAPAPAAPQPTRPGNTGANLRPGVPKDARQAFRAGASVEGARFAE